MQTRPRNIHRMKQPKKKLPVLPFLMLLVVVVLIIVFFWFNNKDKKSTITLDENYNTNVTNTTFDTVSAVKDTLLQDTLTENTLNEAPPQVDSVTAPEPVIEHQQQEINDSDLHRFSDRYDQALRLFYSEQYQKALSILTELKGQFPQHSFQVNCQHWIGECYFGLQDYSNAMDAFKKVLTYGETYKSDDAIMMIGRCYQKMNDKMNARLYFQRLLNEYPMSEFAGKARTHLARL